MRAGRPDPSSATATGVPGEGLHREDTLLSRRAIELATTGDFEFTYQIERRLIKEGFREVSKELSRQPNLRRMIQGTLRASRRGPRP